MASQIAVLHPNPVGRCDVEEIDVAGYAGGVHEDVEPAEVVNDLVEEGPGGVGDVEHPASALSAQRFDGGEGLVRSGLVDVGDDDGGAELGERGCHAAANPAPGADDDSALLGQREGSRFHAERLAKVGSCIHSGAWVTSNAGYGEFYQLKDAAPTPHVDLPRPRLFVAVEVSARRRGWERPT